MKRNQLFIVFIVCIAGCPSSARMRTIDTRQYVATVKSAKELLPVAVQMESLFPEASHFITEFGFSDSPRVWNTEVAIGTRHELTMQVEVEIDYDKNRIKKVVGPLTFYLREIDQIQIRSNGIASASYRPWQEVRFDESKWKVLYSSNGDLSSIAYKPDVSPLAHFQEFIAQGRAPRIHVSLRN